MIQAKVSRNPEVRRSLLDGQHDGQAAMAPMLLTRQHISHLQGLILRAPARLAVKIWQILPGLRP